MYRAKPISQRDGSKLASSNCRMASIATGLDFQTLGKKVSTGAKMRSYTTDQSGGTDSGDARQAWLKGYSEALRVGDGNTWSGALADLRAGRVVHLDVWHATTGGPCLSGSGAYGHTMAVAPEQSGSRWLVADPWCLPARWTWVEEAKLKAGAEEWGRRLRAGTGGQDAYPSRELWLLALATEARELMTRYHAGDNEDDTPDPGETGGPASIMYTATKSQSGGSGGGPDMARFISMGGYDADSGMRINVGAGADWFYFDGVKGGDIVNASALVCFGLLDASGGQFVVKVKTGVPYADKQARDTGVMIKTTNKPYAKPVPPVPPNGGATEAELLKAKQEGYDLALSVFPPRPT